MSAEAVAWSEESSDAELITAARAGDSAAFGALYERHSAAARTVARQYTRSSADAEDVVSDAFARVYSIIRGGGGPDVAFRAYLFTVVRRVAQRRVEAGRRVQPTDDMATFESAFGPHSGVDDPALAGFERGVVAKAYGSLPERWQAVLWYTEVEGLPTAQVAPLLGLTANGVAALAYRAREGLREAYLQQHLVSAPSETCRVVNGKLGAYVRGGLAKRESAQVRAHLEGCAECRNLVLELGDVNHGLRGIIAPLVLGVAGLGALAAPLPVGVLASVGGGAAGGAAGAAGGGAGAGAGAGAAGTASAGSGSAGAAAAGTAGAGTASAGAAGAGATGAGAGAAGAGAAGATVGSGGAAAGSAGAGAAGVGTAAGGVGTAAGTATAGAGTVAGTAAPGALAGGAAGAKAVAGGVVGSTAAGAVGSAGTGAAGALGAGSLGAGSLAGAGVAGAVTGTASAGAGAAGAAAGVSALGGAAATAVTGAAAGVATASGATAMGVAGASSAGAVAGGIGGLIAALPGGMAGAVTAGVVGVSLAVGGALVENAPSPPPATSQAPASTGTDGPRENAGGGGTAPTPSGGAGGILDGPVLVPPSASTPAPVVPPAPAAPEPERRPDPAPVVVVPPPAGPPPADEGPSQPPPGPTPVALVAGSPAGEIVLVPGTETPVVITVTNTGGTDATDLRAALELPEGARVARGPDGTADGWQPCPDAGGGASAELCLASLPGGTSAALSTLVRVDDDAAPASVAIGLRVTAAGAPLGTLTVPATVRPTPPDLLVGGAGTQTLTAGVPAPVAFTVANIGQTPARDVTATVTLPAGARWLGDAGEALPWSCADDGGVVTCRLVELVRGRDGASRADLVLTVVAAAELASVPGLAATLTVTDAGGPGIPRSHSVPLVVQPAPEAGPGGTAPTTPDQRPDQDQDRDQHQDPDRGQGRGRGQGQDGPADGAPAGRDTDVTGQPGDPGRGRR